MNKFYVMIEYRNKSVDDTIKRYQIFIARDWHAIRLFILRNYISASFSYSEERSWYYSKPCTQRLRPVIIL
jgi:hypothetical protein